MKRVISAVGVFCVVGFAFMILKNPEICTKSAISGLVMCGSVIIPSLFPFTFCVLFILKSGLLQKFKIPETYSVFLLSLIGGYPLGSKMLSESQIERKNIAVLLNFCVNAGPAFIILAVGNGVFGSQKVGIVLFISHILPSLIMAFIFRSSLLPTTEKREKPLGLIDNFITSAAQSASTLINISGFVILFSVLCAYLDSVSEIMPFLKPLSLVLEVTNGISKVRNIYLISALLGFGGICIWCQVFSLSKGVKINYLCFVLCRIFHALSSAGFTYLTLKLFKISIPVLSNGKFFTFSPFVNSQAVGISLFIMGIVFIISIANKNYAGNIIEDIV